jgi:hypothetical protein
MSFEPEDGSDSTRERHIGLAIGSSIRVSPLTPARNVFLFPKFVLRAPNLPTLQFLRKGTRE